MRRVALLIAFLILTACSRGTDTLPSRDVDTGETQAASDPSPLHAQLRQYETDARGCVNAIRNAALADAQACTRQLLELGAAMVPAYIARKPDCKAYLEATLKIRDIWSQLSPEVIERDYHHDGALPVSDATAVCYHMKDLIVHPATALKLLSLPEPDRLRAARELEEVVAHAGVVSNGL
jgi:hypothetical protein